MRRLLMTALSAALFTYGCPDATPIKPPLDSPSISQQADTSRAEIKIGTFNIQNFGKSKYAKKDVMEILEEIVCGFDLVAIQEISDKEGKVFPSFVNDLNDRGCPSDYVISERVGKGNQAEQYAFIFNKDKVKFLSTSYIYEDKAGVFGRPPFVAQFKSGDFDYALVTIHTRPDFARQEICGLDAVVKDAINKFDEDDDVIVLGDFNADLPYFNEKKEDCEFRGLKYNWVIKDDVDTSLGKEVKTYDRIVFQKKHTSEDYSDKTGVIRFDEEYKLDPKSAKKISDHYPAYGQFSTMNDSD